MDFLLVLLITFNYSFQDSTGQYAPPQSNLISSIAEWRTFDHSNNFTIDVKQFYSSRYNRFKWIINDESSVIWSLNEKQLKYIFPARIDGIDVMYMNEVKKPFAMEHPAIVPFPDLNEYFCRRENPHYYTHSYICVREIPRGLPSFRTTVWIEDSYGKVIKNVIYEELNSGKQISTKYNLFVYEEPDESVWDIPPNVVQLRPRDGTPEGEHTEELLTWKYLLGMGLIWPDEKHINNRMVTQPILGERNTRRTLENFHQHQSSFPYDPSEYDNIRYPEFLDWERCGKVSPVKDQDICLACTSFAAVDSLQSAYFINTGIWVDMSVQAVIDCSWGEPRNSKPHVNMGCFSGHIDATFEWVCEKGGIPKTQQYGQFKGVNGKCKLPIFNDGSFDLVAPIESYTKVPKNVNAMKMALFRHGPVAVTLTGNEIRDKVNQPNVIIADKPLWNATLSHAALLVGYGVHQNEPYWKVKNSWGLNWGDRGYFYVGITNNSLRLLDEAYYANVENHNYARTYCDICGCPNYVD